MTTKVTKTSQIIALLEQNPDGLTMRELADKLDFKLNIVGGTVYSLINRSMIESFDDEGTKRFRYLGEKKRRSWPTPMRQVRADVIETFREAGENGLAVWEVEAKLTQYPTEQVYFAINRLVYAELAYRREETRFAPVPAGTKQHRRGSRVFALTDLTLPADDLTRTPPRQTGLRKDLIDAIADTGDEGLSYAEIIRRFPDVADASALTVISRLRQDGIVDRRDGRYRICC